MPAATVILEAAEEFEDGERALEFGLAEAYLELTSLPFGVGAKGGRERLRFGLLNELHLHDRPQTDSPDVLTVFFGEEGLTEDGLEVSWVAPLPVYLQAILGVFNGDNEDAFGYGSLRDPLCRRGSGRSSSSAPRAPSSSVPRASTDARPRPARQLRRRRRQVQVHARGLASRAPDRGRRDALRPPQGRRRGRRRWRRHGGARRRLRQEPGEVVFETRDAYGYYVWVDVQPWKRWLFGLRYDWTELPDEPGPRVGHRAIPGLDAVRVPPVPAGLQDTTNRSDFGAGARHAQRAVPPGDLHPRARTRRTRSEGACPCDASSRSRWPLAIALGLPAGGAEAAEKLRVVASLPDFKALTEAVGGDLVEVDTLARGDQNPHDLEIRPSLMVKLRRADLLVRNGIEGDPWVEPLVRGAGNAARAPGGPGCVDVSRGIQVLGVPRAEWIARGATSIPRGTRISRSTRRTPPS